jgi:hypothetical protein
LLSVSSHEIKEEFGSLFLRVYENIHGEVLGLRPHVLSSLGPDKNKLEASISGCLTLKDIAFRLFSAYSNRIFAENVQHPKAEYMLSLCSSWPNLLL